MAVAGIPPTGPMRDRGHDIGKFTSALALAAMATRACRSPVLGAANALPLDPLGPPQRLIAIRAKGLIIGKFHLTIGAIPSQIG